MVMQRAHSFSSLHTHELDQVCLYLYFRLTLPTNLLFVLQTAKYRVETIPTGNVGDPLIHQNHFLIVYTDGALPSNDDNRDRFIPLKTRTSSLTHEAHMGNNPCTPS
jgi:hypothetical protein